MLRARSARSRTHQASISAHDLPCFAASMICKEGLMTATGLTPQGAARAYPAALAHTPTAQVLPTCTACAARPRLPRSRMPDLRRVLVSHEAEAPCSLQEAAHASCVRRGPSSRCLQVLRSTKGQGATRYRRSAQACSRSIRLSIVS